MKTYLFTVIEKRYPNELIKVYRVKNNTPQILGSFTIQRTSTKGYESEVMEFLSTEKHIPSRYNGYYMRNEKKNFQIKGI